ncbi:immunoglobulin domain-containing protein [Candidatus Nitronereus thalassa]|uniref:GDSL-type esterase/lipase family protein n=1 Tax=Candidatus Nitronereus thalassa TaxID=3020898 RepID=A0ABU3K4D9_9BACT|nr:GDSL-type esterase/lipase family protein [Candidatus Nitronereus thalassa]MDT7041241.1 GDSL-type esterase/lipase family protein [Candidatus Nitronereus thalassa]
MKVFTSKSFQVLLCCLLSLWNANPTHAGGPISLFDSGTPTLWGGGTFATFPIPYLKDQGPLGPLTKGEADALTTFSMNEWDAVSNSTFSVIDGGDTPFDITSANASNYLFTFHGAVIDVVYDHDGTICTAIFGCPPGVLGLGGPIFTGTAVPEIASAMVLMNGATIDPLDPGGAAYRVVFSQEAGHAIGLHHDQTNGAVSFFGDESSPTGCPSVGTPTFSDFTAMYPFADVTPFGPGAEAASIDHLEDLDALSRFHPVANYSTTTGTITGTVFQSDGITPVNGVNVIVRSMTNPFGDARSTITGDLDCNSPGCKCFDDPQCTPSNAFEGTFVITGLTPGVNYTLAIDNIVDGAFPQLPAPVFTEEYWNDTSESGNASTDNPCDLTPIIPTAGSTFVADFLLNAPDTTGPTVTINQAAGQTDPTNASPINFTVIFSEPVNDFATGDVTLGGTAGATTGIVTGSGTTYNVAVTGMTSDGTVIATIPEGVATDSFSNANSASTSTDNSVTFSPDTTGPTVTINQAAGQTDPTNLSPVNFTVIFSEPVYNFATGDVTLSGTAGATTATVTGSGTTYNVAVNGGAGAYTWDGNSWADYSAFMSPITSSVKANLQAIMTVGQANGRVLGRMGQIGDSITNSSAYFRNGILHGSLGNETNHDYSNIRSWMAYSGTQPADNSSFYNAYGKGWPYGNFGGWTIRDAVTAGHPSVAVEVGDGITPGQFSWALLMFGTNDIDNFNWDAQAWKSEYSTFIQNFMALGVVPVLSTIPPEQAHIGDGRVELANQKIKELANELNIPFVDFYALVLHYQPINWVGTLISSDGTHPSAGGGGRDFSQTGLTSSDGYAARTKLSWDMAEKLKAIVFDDGPPEDTMTSEGTIIATIAGGVATDSFGNPNTASTSTDNQVTFSTDTTGPTVTINQAAGQPDPTNVSPINFTVVFSEPVADFATGDVTLSGNAGATTATVTGTGTTYNVAVSGMTATGTVTATIAAGVASDSFGNPNTASTSTDNVVSYTVPTGSPVVAWTAVTQNPNGTWTDSSWDNRSFRILLKGENITESGATVQLTLRGRASSSYTLQRVSLVQREGSTLNGLDSTFAPVTFGAAWEAGVTVPAGGTITSDPLAFDLVTGQDVFVTFWAPAGNPTVWRGGGGSGTTVWTIINEDQSAAIDWGSFTTETNSSILYATDQLEVVVTSGPDLAPPVVTPPAPSTVAAVDATGTPASAPAIQAFLTGATAIDNVDGDLSSVITHNAPAQFPLGSTVVTFSVTDTAGHTGTAQATLTVTDQTPPVLTPPGSIAVLSPDGNPLPATEPAIQAFLTGATATDNVDGDLSSVITHDAPAQFSVGATVVTFGVTDTAGHTGTAQATLTVTSPNVAPSITQQPLDQSVIEGQPATFTVTAIGSTPLSYQWQRDGVNIPNATSASYTVNPTSVNDSGATFAVMVTNPAGNITSAPATLTVTPPGGGSVVAWTAVTQNPNGTWTDSSWDNRSFRILLKGENITESGATVQLTLRGRASSSYTLQRVSLVQREGSTLNGLDSTFAPVTFGAAWEAGVTVPAGGTITSDPLAFDLVTGQDVFVTFWAPAGNPTVWRGGGGSGTTVWTIINEDQSAAIDWGSFTTETNSSILYATDQLEVVVTSGPDLAPPVVTPPAPSTVAAVDATGTPASAPAIQAFLTGATAIDNVDGDLSSVITHNAPAQFPLGSTVVTFSVTDTAGHTGTAQATLTVTDQTPPVLTPPGSIAVLSPDGNPLPATEPAIQAFLTGATATDNVDGDLSSVITHDAPAQFSVGATVVTFGVTDTAGHTGTAQATLTVTSPNVAPSITQQPLDQSVIEGQPATFTVTAIGSTPLSYQWQRDGVNIPNATSASYTVNPTSVNDSGATFAVMVTNPAGNITSAPATLTVTPPGGGSVVAWTAVTQNPNGTWTDSSWDNRSFRILLKGENITESGATVQLTLRGRASSSYTLQRVSLVQREGSTLNGLDSTFAPVTFGAAWEAGVTVPAGGTITSDPLAFDLVTGQDVFVTFWAPAGNPTVWRGGGGSGTTVWTIINEDQSAAIDWGSFTTETNSSILYATDQLEVIVTSGPEQ